MTMLCGSPMADYTPKELTEHYVHTTLNLDVLGCPICDAIAGQRGSLIDNERERTDG